MPEASGTITTTGEILSAIMGGADPDELTMAGFTVAAARSAEIAAKDRPGWV
ncbi:MAG: hypothetical protein WBW88_06250 [Rhodothermales bacterium]